MLESFDSVDIYRQAGGIGEFLQRQREDSEIPPTRGGGGRRVQRTCSGGGGGGMVPEPDYFDSSGTDSELEDNSEEEEKRIRPSVIKSPRHVLVTAPHAAVQDDSQLIMPKKPVNPILESSQMVNLHRELMFNNRIGKKVLNQKGELEKEFARRKDQQRLKELQQERLEHRSVLERKMEEQANKLKMAEEREQQPKSELAMQEGDGGIPQPEFMRVHAQLQAKRISIDTT